MVAMLAALCGSRWRIHGPATGREAHGRTERGRATCARAVLAGTLGTMQNTGAMGAWLGAGLVAGAGLLVVEGVAAASGEAPVAGAVRAHQEQVATAEVGVDAASPLQATQLAADYELPRRIVCRPGKDLRLDVEATRLVLRGFTVVRGQAVASYKDIAPGACAGLQTPDNDVGDGSKPRYGVFGPKVAGPGFIHARSPIHVEVSGGKIAKLAPGPNQWNGPYTPSSVDAPFASLLEWFRATDGALVVSIDRDSGAGLSGFRINVEHNLSVQGLAKTTWSAPSYPAPPKPSTGLEPSPEHSSIPRRAICRARAGLSFRRQGNRIEVPAVPVPKRVVNVAADLRPGECAGAAVADNEVGPRQYIPFGAAMTGPMVVVWGGTAQGQMGTPIPRVRPDGVVAELTHGGHPDGTTVTSSVEARGLGSLLRWLDGRPGGMAAGFDHDTEAGGGARFVFRPRSSVDLSEVR